MLERDHFQKENYMRKPLLLTLAISSLFALAIAQQAPTGGGGFGQNPAMQAKMKKYQPWFDLTNTVNLMNDVDKEKGLAFTQAQAKLALPILKDLAARAVLKPEDATKITTKLEDTVINDKQLKWMDDTQLKRNEERRKQMAARAAKNASNGSGIRLPGVGGAPGGGGNRPPGAGGPGGSQRGMFDAIMNDKPYNPFKTGRSADTLKTLTTTLSKR
jgi:hypothetical protein